MALPTSASVVSSGLASYPTVYYDREALDTLESNLFMYKACELKVMPSLSGVAMQIYDHTAFGANTTPVTEGTPGSGQAITQNVKTINLANYADFISFSNKVVLTSISDDVVQGAKLLAYRGALSVDTVTSTAVDTQANADSATRIDVNDGTYLSAALVRKAAMQLRSVNAQPKANGQFFGIVSSLAAYDLINDATAGGWLDLMKYADSTAPMNPALKGIQGARIGIIGGTEFYESNSLPFETNWQSTSHNAYHTYIFGWQAFIASSLGKTSLDQKNFSVNVKQYPDGNSIDVAGLIRAACFYNFFYGLTPTTGSTSKFRRLRSESSIG